MPTMDKMENKVDKKVRGVDEQTWQEGKAAAAKRNITMGDWLNEAMKRQIVRERKK